MQCADARSLLEQGVFPGSGDAVRTRLGFHLAQCASCRGFRVQAEQRRLLHSLLAAPAVVPVGPSLALRSAPVARRSPNHARSVGAALLVAGAIAVVPLGANTPARATTFAAPAAQNLAAPAQARSVPGIAVAGPILGAVKRRPIEKMVITAPSSASRVSVAEETAVELAEAKRAAYGRAAAAPARPKAAPVEWATFAPAAAADAARSQITAFEQAGPQQLAPQLLQIVADDSFATLPLEAGQVLFLPEEPPLPPEPPPAVFVSVESLPALPAAPAAPQPAKPAPKPAAQPVKNTQQAARTYAVKSGDTLTAIAQQLYGDGSRWRAIYEANRNVIGSNPNLIRPSQKLVVPALQSNGGKTPTKPSTQQIYTVRSGDTLSAIALEFYGDGNLWPVLYSANRSLIGSNPDLIFPQQRLAVPGRTQTTKPTGSTKPVPKPAAVKATGKLSYVVAKGDSLRGLALRVYGNESRWQEIYRANRSLIPDADRLQIGITLTIP